MTTTVKERETFGREGYPSLSVQHGLGARFATLSHELRASSDEARDAPLFILALGSGLTRSEEPLYMSQKRKAGDPFPGWLRLQEHHQPLLCTL